MNCKRRSEKGCQTEEQRTTSSVCSYKKWERWCAENMWRWEGGCKQEGDEGVWGGTDKAGRAKLLQQGDGQSEGGKEE